MGHVILPSGTSKWVEDLQGSINLSHLINDLQCPEYTNSYRISIAGALGKLKKDGKDALQCLKEVSTNKDALLAEAAKQAIAQIEGGGTEKRTEETWYKGNTNYSGTLPVHSATHTIIKRPDVNKVTFTPIEGDLYEPSLKTYCRCNFCEKMTQTTKQHKKFSDDLAGPNRFFCNFCLRNEFYTRFNNNVLVFTFRGLIGYYYYAYYQVPKISTMYLIDVQDHIDLHLKVGLQNPLFRYDPETFCWFIDFTKVGKGKRRMPPEAILETVVEILASFNLYENIKIGSPRKFYNKYSEAIMAFAKDRTRIDGDRVFAPTLVSCDIPTICPAGGRALPVDVLQGFLPSHMADNNYQNRGGRRF